MKLKYIFASIVATLAVAVSCEKEADHYLSEIQVYKSYVSLGTTAAVNSADITVTATESWYVAIDENTAKWLTVSPTMGGAGVSTLTFSAPAGEGNTATIQIKAGEKTQYINVIQGKVVITEATVAQIMAGSDGKSFKVTGICTKIANTNYGNWYLKDSSTDEELYIYGTVDATGKYNWPSFGIEVGDEVTVQGPKTTYNGTVELVDVSVVKVNKSLIKVDEVTYFDEEGAAAEGLGVTGGSVIFNLTNKGNGLYVEVPDDAKDWLTIKTIAGNNVIAFDAAANQGGDRETLLVFRTFNGGKEYTCQYTISQKGAIIAATVAEFLAAPVSSTVYRLTGVITSVANPTYGNVYLKDFSGQVYVYGIGAKGDFEKLGLKEGDIVTLLGTRGEYKGTAQMVGGQYESHIPVTTVTVAEFLAAAVDQWGQRHALPHVQRPHAPGSA